MRAQIFSPEGETQNDEGDGLEDLPEEVNDETLDDLDLAADVCEDAQAAWEAFLEHYPSRQAAGEAIFASVFDVNPSLQVLFKTPTSVLSTKFVNGFSSVVSNAGDPASLKPLVETLGFQHMDFDINRQKIQHFRDAIVDLLEMDLGGTVTAAGKYGIAVLINYVGGACMFIRREYAARVRIIHSSWATATKSEEPEEEPEKKQEGSQSPEDGDEENPENSQAQAQGAEAAGNPASVPTGFFEMFMFNAAVMGYNSGQQWMDLILEQLDNIVKNIANTARVQEECSTLALRVDKFSAQVEFREFKSVAMSSLKACVADWGDEHEVAWDWLWGHLDRMLTELRGKPSTHTRRLGKFLENLSEEDAQEVRESVHQSFFKLAPAGQDYFKQSNTRLYFISQMVIDLSLRLYEEPDESIRQISELGLKHVGLSIPTEFFPPFVTAVTMAFSKVSTSEAITEAFRWSIALIGKVLARTVIEGSTLVTKAVTTDDDVEFKKAIAIAPRGKRAAQILNITVGTQSISPLYWAIDNGSLKVAGAMFQDLLTIRADRTVYFYGCDALFQRHPDVLHYLIVHARSLIQPFLDGLIWRSRTTIEGQRRVNYYVKHLIQDADGNFSQALEWVAESQDAQLACHPVLLLVSDTIWDGLASRFFILDRFAYMFFLLLFILSQSFLQHLNGGSPDLPVRVATFSCRIVVYVGSLAQLLYLHARRLRSEIRDIRRGKENSITWCCMVPVPSYLLNVQNVLKFLLLLFLVLTCAVDPMIWCLANGGGELFTQNCSAGSRLQDAYSTLSMMTMLIYWLILSGLSILSMRLAAFALGCAQVLEELGLFLGALVFLILMFASSMSCLDHSSAAFTGMPKASISLWEISVGMFSLNRLEGVNKDPVLLLMLAVFVTLAVVFLLSLLVAQFLGVLLTRHEDMVGYARLKRCSVVVSTVRSLSGKRWADFLETLQLEEPLEFSEGDIGFAGGIQVTEPASDHPTSTETIVRFGGSASASMPWPESSDFQEDPYEVLERQILHLAKKTTAGAHDRDRPMTKVSGSHSSQASSVALSGVDSPHSDHTSGSTE